eukprot:12848246-Ditylum_brightwellii.AAC.1
MNKQTGEREHIGECPKTLNYFNQTMYGVNCWDLILEVWTTRRTYTKTMISVSKLLKHHH